MAGTERSFVEKIQYATALVTFLIIGWVLAVVGFGWAKGTGIAIAALFALFAERTWIDERIDERIAAREPEVWYFYYRLIPAFIERTATAAGASWQAEKFGDGFSPQFTIEVHPHRRWCPV
jgi:hypothetical protein